MDARNSAFIWCCVLGTLPGRSITSGVGIPSSGLMCCAMMLTPPDSSWIFIISITWNARFNGSFLCRVVKQLPVTWRVKMQCLTEFMQWVMFCPIMSSLSITGAFLKLKLYIELFGSVQFCFQHGGCVLWRMCSHSICGILHEALLNEEIWGYLIFTREILFPCIYGFSEIYTKNI